DNLGVDIDVTENVETLSIAKKQIVEIAKGIIYKCKILIMDEPSSALSKNELKILFKLIEQLKKDGMTIIYISHRLNEIFEVADMVTVLRDGSHIKTMPVNNVNRQLLIEMIVGRTLESEYPKEYFKIGEIILEVKNICRKGVLHNISFDVKKGEIMGLAGLMGAGRTEIARAILGIDKIDSGKIIYKNQQIHNKNFRASIKNGFGLVPEDRKQQGLVLDFSVKQNICMVNMNKCIKGIFIKKSLEDKYSKQLIKDLKILTPSIDTLVKDLSGGNQQKVVLAKWLLQDSEIIILDEPTRGVDVGGKVEIYKLLNSLIKIGKSVILISSEMPELLGMCDRILVVHDGYIVGEFSQKEATQEKILELCV
ncbi:MAG: sugar ABC transporter ATP-binding protein, partial [Actinobacteria bacterium]|nr:sugar ABC transporter ATP-binding protein [Actinomycetota bacterium]